MILQAMTDLKFMGFFFYMVSLHVVLYQFIIQHPTPFFCQPGLKIALLTINIGYYMFRSKPEVIEKNNSGKTMHSLEISNLFKLCF